MSDDSRDLMENREDGASKSDPAAQQVAPQWDLREPQVLGGMF